MYNILICDDETDIRYALKIYLKSENYSFAEAENGEEAIRKVEDGDVDLVLLDVMMPVMDGITALSKIREISNVPVIMLSAKSERFDIIAGLDSGADDYITKPFDPMDVRARVSASLRRYTHLGSKVFKEGILKIGAIELDDMQKKVLVDGEEVSLTFSEYEILKLLMKNPDKCFAPSEIYNNIWKENALGNERTIAVHIRHLREKIEIDPANPRYLTAVWGQGYRIVGGNA